MDGKTSSSKNCDDTDADVDHYFLPGGILDTPSHEEDMIGGSLLDEIGGMRNVTRVSPDIYILYICIRTVAIVSSATRDLRVALFFSPARSSKADECNRES